MIPTIVIQHPKEKRKKCSLEPLRGREPFTFHRAGSGFSFDASGYTLLSLDGDPVDESDAVRPLLLLDSTWRLLPQLENCLHGEPIRRSLPKVATAYPRTSKIAPDPDNGLASVEALYLAQYLMGQPDADEVLKHYHWQGDFKAAVHAYFFA